MDQGKAERGVAPGRTVPRPTRAGGKGATKRGRKRKGIRDEGKQREGAAAGKGARGSRKITEIEGVAKTRTGSERGAGVRTKHGGMDT